MSKREFSSPRGDGEEGEVGGEARQREFHGGAAVVGEEEDDGDANSRHHPVIPCTGRWRRPRRFQW